MMTECPPQPAWMEKYMKTGKDLERQLQNTVLSDAPYVSPYGTTLGKALEYMYGDSSENDQD